MKCYDYWWYLKGISRVFEERGRILISDFWSIDCIVCLNRMIETRESIPCLWVHVLYVTQHRVAAHMILRPQISFPLPKAYNSIPSNCGVLYVPFEESFRLSRARPASWVNIGERWGKNNTTLSHRHKKALEWSRNLITMVVHGLGYRKGI